MSDPMIDFLNELEKDITSIGNSLEKQEKKARLEEAMRVYSGEDKLISSIEILERIKTEPEEYTIKSGFQGLDSILGGFRRQQLIVLAAPTKSGKTSFCVELTIRMEHTNPVWLPFEESAEELIRKFHERGDTPPLFYTPQSITGNTVEWVEKKIVEGKVKYGSELFFIDHLHFIVPLTSDRLDTRIGQTMRNLKTIAKAHNVTIVLVAHLKKTSMIVSPTLEDLRDSSFIAQEADTVMLLWRKAGKNNDGEMQVTNKTVLSVQANRRTGKTGNVKLVFSEGRFTEEEWKHDDVQTEIYETDQKW